jgi:hypothetical protein
MIARDGKPRLEPSDAAYEPRLWKTNAGVQVVSIDKKTESPVPIGVFVVSSQRSLNQGDGTDASILSVLGPESRLRFLEYLSDLATRTFS